MCLESSLQKVISSIDRQNITVMMLKILQWWSKHYFWLSEYYRDVRNIIEMFKILQWCSNYYSDAPDITDAGSKEERK